MLVKVTAQRLMLNSWRLRRPLHRSWLIAVMAVAVVAGVMLARLAPQGFFASGVWLVVGGLLAGFGLVRARYYALLVVMCAGCLVGLWRGSLTIQALTAYKAVYGVTLRVDAVVADDPELGKGDQTTLHLSSVMIDGKAYPGVVWATVGSHELKRGDHVTLHGKLQQGFGTYAAVMYRATVERVVQPQPGDVARRVRDWFASAVRRAIPEPEASLGNGYILGQHSALPAGLSEALVTVGLTHVVVASGYNLTILVRLARRLFQKISKYLSALAASLMIVGFMAVTGLSPSMSRAGLVAGLSLLAWYYGRTFHPLVLLALAAGVTVIAVPSYAWGDVGWGLSFTAFAGVMIMAPLLQRYFFGDKKPGVMRQIFGETLAAHLWTAPIVVMTFGLLSNVALIANVLVLPLVPLAMLLTFIAGLAAVAVPSIAPFVGLPAYYLLHYMTTVAGFLAGLPWASEKLSLGVWGLVACYAVLVLACVYLWRATRFDLKQTNIVQ